MVKIEDAPQPPRRRLRRARPKDSDREPDPQRLPVSTLTVIRPDPLGAGDRARGWLDDVRDDDAAIRGELDGALELINQALHAHRTATLDPHLADVSPDRALAVRIGFGTGDQLAEARFAEAIDVPHSARRRRLETLRPQERIAAVVGGRERVPPAELLLLRARADLDAGRTSEAALQLRIGVDALLFGPRRDSDQAEAGDLAAIDERRGLIARGADEALQGELSDERVAELTETLRLCERVLRRRALA
ncbi:MAG: hypothetical protein ACJ75R_05960 [Solirubrobacterales bacterium]